MKQSIKRISIGLLALFLLPAGLLATGQAEQPVYAFLSRLPAAALQDRVFRYVDIEALVKARPGATQPADTEDFEKAASTKPRQAYVLAMTGAAAGLSPLSYSLLRSAEFEEKTGLNFFGIKQLAEAGVPPHQQLWLAGDFDEERLKEALGEKGYQETKGNFAMRLWCEEGNCGKGLDMDLSQRDPDFLFGGTLGRKWPVAFGEGVLVSSPSELFIRAVASQEGQMLTDNKALMALLEAVLSPDGNQGGSLSQLTLVPADQAFLTALPSALPFALAHLDREDAQWVVLGLAFPDAAAARKAAEALPARIEKGALQDGSPVKDRLEALKGVLGQQRVETLPDGEALLVMPFRFPSQREETEESPEASSALPFHFFSRMLMKRDLDWLITE